MATSIPMILCGKSPQIAAGVKAGLLPEYEVIHVILTPAAGESEIPILLAGQVPPSQETENVGTRNYSKTPMAIVLGAGYDDEAFEAMRSACAKAGIQGEEKGKGVPWLRPDLTVETPPLGPLYGKHMVERVKVSLGKLNLGNGEVGDGVFWF